MIKMLNLENYCENWQKARIQPKQKAVEEFIKKRTKDIKRLMSTAHTPNQEKAHKEEKYLTAVIELDEEYQEFVKSVSTIVWKCIEQYGSVITQGGRIVEENNFLKDRIKHLEERELTYLQLLTKRNERK